jgi:putative heme transporter
MVSRSQMLAGTLLESRRLTIGDVRRRLEPLVKRIPTRVVRLVLTAAATAVVAAVAFRSRSLLAPLGTVTHPRLGWLTLAVLAEAASLGAYALIVRNLLGFGDVAARIRSLLRATVGGIAMSASLPGGQAASAAYWYKQLRREGADGGLAALAMIGSMLAGVLSLGGVLVIGVAAAGHHGPLAPARVPILAAGGVLLILYWILRRRVVGASAWFMRRFTRERADRVSASRRDIAAIGVLAYANWLFDCASLFAALAAVHAHVPLQSIVLTYAIAQLVASLPLLPGGGGTVELSLVLGFAAFGHTSGSVLAGVLLFRLISCWGLVPVGWLAVVLDGRGFAASKIRRRPQAFPVPST